MKKILALAVVGLFSLVFSFAQADTIPMPVCVNGLWQVPAGWELYPPLYASPYCDKNDFLDPSKFHARSRVRLIAYFFDPYRHKEIAISTQHYTPTLGDWTWEAWYKVCPPRYGWTNVNNCQIAPLVELIWNH